MKTQILKTTLTLGLLFAPLASASAAEAGSSTTGPEVDIDYDLTLAGEHDEDARKPVTFLGLEVTTASAALAAQLGLPEGQGLVVRFVAPDSPAAAADMRRHDLLLRLDDQILIEPRQFAVLVRSHKKGDTVILTFLRGGQEMKAEVTLGERKVAPRRLHWRSAEPHGFQFEGDIQDVVPRDFTEGMNGFEERMKAFRERMRQFERNHEHRAAGVPNVMILRPNTEIVVNDDEGELRLESDNGKHILVAKDPDGKELYSGPIDTPADRENLPPELLERLRKLERMEVVPPVPPAPPVAPAVPMMPVAPGPSEGPI